MTLGNILVTSCCMQTLHSLFVSRPPSSSLPPERNAQLIVALFDYQPAPSDTQQTLAWLAVLQEAYINLSRYYYNFSSSINQNTRQVRVHSFYYVLTILLFCPSCMSAKNSCVYDILYFHGSENVFFWVVTSISEKFITSIFRVGASALKGCFSNLLASLSMKLYSNLSIIRKHSLCSKYRRTW